MSSSLFPSGDWYGFYTYDRLPGKHPMDIRFTFENGRISAAGGDPVGEFVLDGAYSEGTKECFWIKTYPGRHSVAYHGFREGKGIWGTWNVSRNTGGFHIWPLNFGSLVDHRVEEEFQPVAEPAHKGESSDMLLSTLRFETWNFLRITAVDRRPHSSVTNGVNSLLAVIPAGTHLA